MKALGYYLSFPFIYIFSLLPLSVLFILSNIFYYVVFYIIGYRKNIVYKNISNSFPGKSDADIKQICKNFYRHFCDIIAISVKCITINEKEIMAISSIKDDSELRKYRAQNRNILFVLGHYGFWEMSPSFGIQMHNEVIIAYKPLLNKYYDGLVKRSRTRFNHILIPNKKLYRYLQNRKDDLFFLLLIADQSPKKSEPKIWVKFLNQDTAVVAGMEKIAKKYDCVVFYESLKRKKKRGYSEISFKLLTDDINKLPENKLTELYMKNLEQDILNDPASYLWSHKRWKLSKEIESIK